MCCCLPEADRSVTTLLLVLGGYVHVYFGGTAIGKKVVAGNALAYSTQETITLGLTTTLTAIVGITALASPPTGTVTFKNGGTVIGIGTLGPAPYYNPSVASATLNISTLPLGTNGQRGTRSILRAQSHTNRRSRSICRLARCQPL